LREGTEPRKTPAMIRFFDIADHDRLPWRFQGAQHTVLAHR
jgi:hypothetical protein